jgi:hypothetical protein
MGRFLGCHCASAVLGRHEILFSAFDRNHPGHHLPGYCQRGAVAIAPLFFLLVDQAQFMAVSRCQLRRFHQHLLDMFVALFGMGVRTTLSAERFSAPHSPQ